MQDKTPKGSDEEEVEEVEGFFFLIKEILGAPGGSKYL